MTEYLIQAQGLYKSFGENHAVNDLSLRIERGEIYGLVGSDGAGKTTTLRLLVGAMLPDAGMITIDGLDLFQHGEEIRARIGYLSQRFSLYEELSVLENIRFFAEVRGLSTEEWLPRSMDILEFVGLVEFSERRAGQLSGGMKQKLGLASALVHRPRILLLDEPTTGVDPVTRQDFWQLIIRLVSDERLTVLISTPYMDEAAHCGRLGFLRDGSLLKSGTPAELRSALEGSILELRGEPLRELRLAAAMDKDILEVHTFGDRLHLRVATGQTEALIERLPDQLKAKGGKVERLRVIPPTLEDVFISLTSSEIADA